MINLSDLRSKKGKTPPGTIKLFSGSSVPPGWLLCDGSVVAQASYPRLFDVVGTTYDTGGEGAGNFRLPDLRGKFDRVLDNLGTPAGPSGLDSGRALGSSQAQAFEGHNHPAPAPANNSANTGGVNAAHSHSVPWQLIMATGNNRAENNNSGPNQISTTGESGGSHSHPLSVGTSVSVSIGNAGSPETRPLNISSLYAIKI